MKITKNKFSWALYLLLVYELVMIIFGLSGFSVQKLFFTSFLWIVVSFELITFIKEYATIKQFISRFALITFILLVLWNLFGIARSIINGTEKIYTLFGNINTTLMLLIPFSFVFAFNINNVRVINKYFNKILLIVVIISMLIIFESKIFVIDQSIMNFLVLAVLLLPQLFSFSNWKRIFIILISILIFTDAWILDSRAMMIRIPLFLMCLGAVLIYKKLKIRSILFISFIVVSIPFILLNKSINSNKSFFSQFSDKSPSTIDNRTWLYAEVFDDLISTKTIIQGKGASGTYYSPTMSIAKVDSENRPSVEVGILAILLKGGVVATLFTLILLITAIYMAFFRSNNYYTIGIGYFLLVHFLILFVENLVQFNTYNILVWFFIGICLNEEIRQMSDQEINNLIRYGYVD